MSPKIEQTFDKFTSSLSNLPKKIMDAHPLKKAYGSLWFITGVLLIAEIAMLIAWAGNKIAEQDNAIAAIGVLFVAFMIAAVFTTVIASKKFKRMQKMDAVKKAGK